MTGPTVSVVVPSYNHAEFLPAALGSVLAQTVRPLEVLVGDDASTDGSLAVAEEFARRDPLVRVVPSERNLGVMATVNRLAERARGEYLFCFGADDRALPNLLERSMDMLARYPQAAICSSLSRLIGRDGGDLGRWPTPVVRERPAYLAPAEVAALLPRDEAWFVTANTTVWHREGFVAAGGLRAELQSLSDSLLSMALALRHGACFIPEALGSWRRLETGFSATASADPERGRAMRAAAVDLMTGEWADAFPPGYADEWLRWQEVADVLGDLDRRRQVTLRQMTTERPQLGRVLTGAARAEHWAVKGREAARRGLSVRPMFARRLRAATRR